MATKKIRVYELARELGVENAVVLDLANELKIGVKSHSSSIDDPSADRVRRLADSKGLRREPVVEEPEPEPAPPPPEPEKVPAAEKAPAPVAEPAEPEVAPPPP
ncbi:MAG TPA: translation initiation factor IF-2 N-terminal domain-containing protein, partial [Acidimicrobiia bacterium]|nr:translation initiation factor IF-2 N-terminal domain-containing protein [Acidimicrobiia bacterium]